MAPIVSPQPRRVSPVRLQSPPPLLLSPPIYLADNLHRRMASTTLNNPPRLLSPFQLADPKAHHNKSPSCTSTKRRRTTRNTRRRICPRSECPFSNGPAFFDQLSWISQIEDPQQPDLRDIADLSVLPIDPLSIQSSGIGPVRSRKSSLRSNPMAANSPAAPEEVPPPRSQRRTTSISSVSSTSFLPLLDREVRAPRTPPPPEKFNLSNVPFAGLMPALPLDLPFPSFS